MTKITEQNSAFLRKISSISSVITTYQVKCHKIQELLFRNFLRYII